MKRFFRKLVRFFWSWGFLKFVLWTVTLIILFYAEEDWRGARAWAATKAEWEAKGETFDFARMLPPPVPDDENLAALPLFKMEPEPQGKGELKSLTFQRAFHTDEPDYASIRVGNWQNGTLFDLEKIRNSTAIAYAKAFKNVPRPDDPLAEFDALYPALANLRAAAATRPYCRFPQKYSFDPPYNIYMAQVLNEQMAVSKILDTHAVLALVTHQPDVALADIQTNLKIASGARNEPLLVSGLVSVAVTAITFSAVYDGLSLHQWSDAQLSDLQNELSEVDFLTSYQNALRGEAVGMTVPALDNLKANRSRLEDDLKRYAQPSESESNSEDLLPNFWSDGWIDLMKSDVVDFHFTAAGFVDPKARLVFPKAVHRFAAKIEQRQRSWDARAPWHFLNATAADSISDAVQRFALMQAWVDEARIVCALERHRLAHAAYPESLDALVPACIDALPHDIMNGQPYHYQLRPDGTYLLYSVGWNQTDDGGKVFYEKGIPTLIDYKQGDWVWPTPKAAQNP